MSQQPPQPNLHNKSLVSGSHGVRRNVGFWAEIGEDLDMSAFQCAVKKVLKALNAGKDVLVHCVHGKHRSGAFLCFALCLLCDCDLQTIFDRYCQDPFLRPHDRRLVGKAPQNVSVAASRCRSAPNS